MKNSGIEWIGQIPNDWNLTRSKFIAKTYTGNSIKDEQKSSYEDSENAVPYIATKNIVQATGEIDKSDILFVKNEDISFVRAYQGDILMCIEGGSAGRKKTFLTEEVCFVNKLCCFHPTGINPRYLYYTLQSPHYESEFRLNLSGLIGGVSRSKLDNFTLTYPPEFVQKKIVDYLDKKCANVDDLIAVEQAQIEKLKEYKQSVITEVVTKGLNPDVPMKDSGVEWIGEIPAHWKTTRIKNLFELRNERNDEADLSKVNLISLYTDLGVVQHSDIVETTGNKAVTAEGYKLVYKNDIVVNIILCWMGAVGMSNYDGVTSPAYDIYQPKNGTLSEYYHYLFRTKRFNGECYRYGRGIMLMRWRTYSTEFTAIRIPEPPKNEQIEILSYLKKKSEQIDSLISIKQEKIEKLQVYKKSLIYEYVTGKKEVI